MDPMESAAAIVMERYEVLVSEPLHNLKGHIMNVITEVPTLVPEGKTVHPSYRLMLSKEQEIRSRPSESAHSGIPPAEKFG